MTKTSENIYRRKIEIDILRIIAGLAVVSIHVTDSFVGYPYIFGGLSWFIADFINSTSRIAVPLFVMISGYLAFQSYEKYGIGKFLRRRVSRLFIPFIFWTAFYFLWPHFFPERS